MFRELPPLYDRHVISPIWQTPICRVTVRDADRYWPICVTFGALVLTLSQAESVAIARALLDANKVLPPPTKETK